MVDLSFIKGSGILKAIGLNSSFDPGSPQGLIQYACKLRQPVTITIDGHLTKFRSFFLEMNDDGETFHMDDLTPRVDEELVPDRTVMRASFDMHGVGRHFRTIFRGKDQVDGYDALRLTVPDEIDTVQRREYFRVRPRLGDPVNVLFQYRELKRVTGVVDISAGGICFNSTDRISSGVGLPSVIKLPSEHEHFRVKLSTRGVDKLQNPENEKGKIIKPYRIRAQFNDLVIADLHALDKYIMGRQREAVNTIR